LEKESQYYGAIKKGRLSPSQEEIRPMHGEGINYKGEFAWGRKDANGECFESPNIRKDLNSFSGPVLSDVAKTMHVAHDSMKKTCSYRMRGA
jgi:hypothetical protein